MIRNKKGQFVKGKNLGNTNGFQKGHTLTCGRPAPWARNLPQGFKKGMIPWNKGKRGTQGVNCGSIKKGERRSKSTEFEKGQVPWNKGLRGYKEGEENNMWKGGITKLGQRIRTSADYKLWRDRVYELDNHTCQFCKKIGGNLNADHVIPFAEILRVWRIKTLGQARACPDLWDVLNGRTLCRPCHVKTETYANQNN